MDTKWKNLIKEAKAFLKLNWPLIPGAVLILTGIYLEYFMLVDADYRPMDESVIIGLTGNFVLGAGVVMTLGQILKIIYENWVPEDESFYEKWKETGKKLDRIAAAAGAVCVVAAYIYLYTLISWHNYGNYYWNYAAGYMMAFTIVVQYILAQIVLNRFKNRKMDLLMEQMEEVNRRRIDVALEIEKNMMAAHSTSAVTSRPMAMNTLRRWVRMTCFRRPSSTTSTTTTETLSAPPAASAPLPTCSMSTTWGPARRRPATRASWASWSASCARAGRSRAAWARSSPRREGGTPPWTRRTSSP